MEKEKIGKYIRKKRIEKGMTQQQLAEKIQVTEKAVSRWETGRGVPDISLLEPLAEELHVSVTELLNGEERVQEEAVSDDGLTYTFHLRKGASWVDSQGRKIADVTADDFVAGMQHMMDAQGGLEYLIEGIIVNASQYISGEVTDFSQVGVKAVDDYTLEYTLESPCSYFLTMMGYSIFAPHCIVECLRCYSRNSPVTTFSL